MVTSTNKIYGRELKSESLMFVLCCFLKYIHSAFAGKSSSRMLAPSNLKLVHSEQMISVIIPKALM